MRVVVYQEKISVRERNKEKKYHIDLLTPMNYTTYTSFQYKYICVSCNL